MEDFIFGTMATDELKLIYYRGRTSGIQHNHRLNPMIPRPGKPVRLTISTGPDTAAQHAACYYTMDGSTPDGSRGVARNGTALICEPGTLFWNSLVWGYVQEWHCELPALPEGSVVRYIFSAWNGQDPELYANWPDGKLRLEECTSAFFKNEAFPITQPGDPDSGTVFSYVVGKIKAPAWAHDAVIYHLFLDRFNPGQGRAWNDTDDIGTVHGGTLWGVAEKLDYIQNLGANAIWLSPTWPSPSVHGYDIIDYMSTHPRLGGDEAMRTLVQEAHARGMRVILDLVCNHMSNEHPIFQEAQRDPASPYRPWFFFDDSELGYRSFFGVHNMPQINLSHPGGRDWMLDIARYWLEEFEVDGYRLDHANGPAPDFWQDFSLACKSARPDAFVFGEVVEPPDIQRSYMGRLDGLLDFHLTDNLRRLYGFQSITETQFERFLGKHQKYFADPEFIMLSFLDNHDMDRIGHIAGGDTEQVKAAVRRQFSLPGTPIIFYGSEIGLQQTHSVKEVNRLDVSRLRMDWRAPEEHELFRFYQGLIADRRAKTG